MTDYEIMKKAIAKYGNRGQLVVAIEEMSELQKELCKALRGKGSRSHIAEEIADVEIMLKQLKIIFNNANLCAEYYQQKLIRLNNRINGKED